jgi:hypothetical protein
LTIADAELIAWLTPAALAKYAGFEPRMSSMTLRM